jgi:large subunit ribosomal protein L25
MANPTLTAKPRKILGRKVKKLRREGVLPANLYGKKIKSQALELPVAEFLKVFKQAGETSLIDLKIDSQTRPVLIDNLQIHPVTDEPLHVDFRQVSLTEKTTADVPVEVRGDAPAVEQKKGILIQPLAEIEVEALPADLPDHLVIDVSKLEEVDQAITVGDLVYDKKKVKVLADPNEIVVKINPLEEEEVAPPPPEEEVAEGEVPEGEEMPEGKVKKPAEEVAPPKESGRPEPAEGKAPEEKPSSAPAKGGAPKGGLKEKDKKREG